MFGVNPKQKGARLSYLHLIETSVAAAFRALGVSLQRIRSAHEYLQHRFSAEFPFAQLKLKTDGAHVIKEFNDPEITRKSIIIADAEGQTAWKKLIAEKLMQFDFDDRIAIRWYPNGRNSRVVVDPQFSFGSPTIVGKGIATWAIQERVEIGETHQEIADDFGLGIDEVEAAIAFHQELALA